LLLHKHCIPVLPISEAESSTLLHNGHALHALQPSKNLTKQKRACESFVLSIGVTPTKRQSTLLMQEGAPPKTRGQG